MEGDWGTRTTEGGESTGGGQESQGEPEICRTRGGGAPSFLNLALLLMQTDTCQKATKA